VKDRTKYFAYPYVVWIFIFIALPAFLVLLYSVTTKESNGLTTIHFTWENFKNFFQPLYLNILWDSIYLAAISTIICLMLGYPAAYIISKAHILKGYLVVHVHPANVDEYASSNLRLDDHTWKQRSFK